VLGPELGQLGTEAFSELDPKTFNFKIGFFFGIEVVWKDFEDEDAGAPNSGKVDLPSGAAGCHDFDWVGLSPLLG
jgi:hypothetical protein